MQNFDKALLFDKCPRHPFQFIQFNRIQHQIVGIPYVGRLGPPSLTMGLWISDVMSISTERISTQH